MTLEHSIRFLAGTMIIASLTLDYFYPNGYWLYLTAFVGLNLFQSSFTKFCPAEIIMKNLFYKKK